MPDGSGTLIVFHKGGDILIKNGLTGNKGENGNDGANGENGSDGANGTDGTDGKDGVDGQNGADGQNGSNGTDGTDGHNGSDGQDGKINNKLIKKKRTYKYIFVIPILKILTKVYSNF